MIFFDKIIKRVTNFPVQSYQDNKNDIGHFFNTNDLFQLSILTSSRSLYEDVKKNKTEKTAISLSKYFIRAHFNTIPFGTFNSVGILQWNKETSNTKSKALTLNVKYDNLFLSRKVNDSITSEWKIFSYCINPSICFLNNSKISFYSSKNDENGKIELSYVEIDYDDDLQWIIDRFRDCVKIILVIQELISEGHERINVENYLFDLIQTGLIIEEFLYCPYNNKLENLSTLFSSKLIKEKSHTIESQSEIVSFTNNYIKEQNVFFENNKNENYSHIINAFDLEHGFLDSNIQNKIHKYIDFSLNYNSKNTPINEVLGKFINQIGNQFNEGYIPLNKIFNPYSGLNYASLKNEYKLKLDDNIINKILSSKKEYIILDLPELDNSKIKASALPATFSVVFKILICKVTGEKTIYFEQLGCASALNLLSRFSYVTSDICKEIVNYEKEVDCDKILADINCISTFRSINIGSVNQFYDYCISINTSNRENSNPIFLSDIYLHLRGESIALVSKKYCKEILPKKTSAINPNLSSSDVYKFLCDFECYNQEIYGVNFDFNAYDILRPYIPRIYLEKNVLLYPAQILLSDNNFNIGDFKNYLPDIIQKNNFTSKIVFSDQKGSLIIDTENENDLAILFENLKMKRHFFISESLYESFDPGIIKDSENFAHELVVSVKNPYYNRQKLDYSDVDFAEKENLNTAVVSDWLYLELFCNSYADAEILKSIYSNIILENKCDLFFFVHYSNPERHLRLRFKTDSYENKEQIINLVHDLKLKSIIRNYHILPYEQEVHRYGGIEMMALAEAVFDLDSRDFLINVVDKDLDDVSIQITSILKIKFYLDFLNFSLEEMILHCENSINGFSKEFELTTALRKDFNKNYANIRFKIDESEYVNCFKDEMFKNIFLKQLKESKSNKLSIIGLIIHMSMNRHFIANQRFNEFKSYYLLKCYLNQLKFKEQLILKELNKI